MRQSSSAKAMRSSNIIGKKMKRLQCRSYPLGAKIAIDGKATGKVTPWTFNDLEAGEHTIEMTWHDKKQSETALLEDGKRKVCKLYFKEPEKVK